MAFLNLDLDYFDHPKVGRLIGQLGRGADMLPVRLWCYCGKFHAETGELNGYSPLEIETAIKWWGQPGRAVETLVSLGFLDKHESGFKVHDWDKINGHIGAFKARAQAGAKARWEKARADAQAMLKHNSSNPPSNALQEAGKVGIGSSPDLPGGDARGGGFKLEVRSEEAVAHAAARRPKQDQGRRAADVLSGYPTRSKDGRAVRIDLAAHELLSMKIAESPDYPWEEAARLERLNDTPMDAVRWISSQPDPILLATRRRQSQENPKADGPKKAKAL
jgi:hypothetical protein